MTNQALPKNIKWKDRRDAALAYADHGLKVFPVYTVLPNGQCACGDSGCIKPGKHPMSKHGHKDASASKDWVKEHWSTKSEKPNIGMATGSGTGLVVLDADIGQNKNGMKSLKMQGYGKDKLGATRRVRSQSGGRHFYFLCGGHVLKSRTGLFEGVDARANGGSIILPPSLGTQGFYKYENDLDVQPIPEWLLEVLTAEPPPAEPPIGKGMPTKVPEGIRNETLFHYCLKLRAKGLSREEMLSLAEQSNSTFIPPMVQSEIANIVHSAMKYAPQFPHTQEGFADQFVHEYGHVIGYEPAGEQWYAFDTDSGLWRPREREVHKRVNQMIRNLLSHEPGEENET